MMVLRVYQITNTVFVKSKLRKNDLIIVVFYGNLTDVRKEGGEDEKTENSWDFSGSHIDM